jgi:preprotein translocase subunit SecA
MFGRLATKVFGTKHDRDIKRLAPLVDAINAHYAELQELSEEDLRRKTEEFRQRLTDGETLDDLLPEAYAVVKEACRRLLGRKWEVCDLEVEWDMVPFDVQLVGAIVLHQGRIAEMATGEGKTLVATMPLYLNALPAKGAHLVTVNDYLARRDAQWMGEVYKYLGLTVGCIQSQMRPEERIPQYHADITYGTNNEFGFDYLRDNMALSKEERVQRGHHYAIVDEVDSALVDEARTPLIISGPVGKPRQSFTDFKPRVAALVRKQTNLINSILREGEQLREDGQEYEAGIKLLQVQRGSPKNKRFMKLLKEQGVKKLIHRVETDYMRDKRLGELDEDLYYSIDEKGHSIDLTEKGREELSPRDRHLFVLPDLSIGLQEVEDDESVAPVEKTRRKEELLAEYAETSEKIHSVQQLLKAYSLFEKDVEYVVQDGRVMIVDEFTGRLMPGRRYSDGLHQALEAKEGVKIEQETQTVATITLQNYFRLYDKLAGMTGTAETEASEFHEIYKLDVVVIPTNEPVRRVDYNDVIYRTRREKYNAVIEEIARMNEMGRPVLVGTVNVDVSETLSRMLKRRGIHHSVLNAKYHQKEAAIVAAAGQSGAVTIATNMAGRGTDIKLAPAVLRCPRCCIICLDHDCENCPNDERHPECVGDVPCGLHIVGTERHEARRIDRQLRGRSGRQGDPGSSRFFLSLEDDLMRLFGSERIATIMDKLGAEEGEVIEHPWVTKAVERAQRRVEGHNFDIRKHLLEYDDVMNQQREVIYDRRLAALEGEDLREETLTLLDEVTGRLVDQHCASSKYPEDWNWDGLEGDLTQLTLHEFRVPEDDRTELHLDELQSSVQEFSRQAYDHKEALVGSENMRRLERLVNLTVIDEKWRDHLYEMDQLKAGIGLRAYGQKDPLLEYKQEGFGMFVDMLDNTSAEVIAKIFRATLVPRIPAPVAPPSQITAVHPEFARASAPPEPEPVGAPAGAPGGQPGAQVGRRGRRPPPGEPPRIETVRVGKKVGRNDPCPCGSGKKYKKCCGA